ncbi:hypothetical protein TNCV_864371 [Trichonephila clavipes]|nr:hypothetical protein TNCV_864371 [Trichonephila clavipes]
MFTACALPLRPTKRHLPKDNAISHVDHPRYRGLADSGFSLQCGPGLNCEEERSPLLADPEILFPCPT